MWQSLADKRRSGASNVSAMRLGSSEAAADCRDGSSGGGTAASRTTEEKPSARVLCQGCRSMQKDSNDPFYCLSPRKRLQDVESRIKPAVTPDSLTTQHGKAILSEKTTKYFDSL